MRRYIGMAAGLGLMVAALSATGALTAAAQGPAKTVLSLIVNDATQPVPVTGTVTATVAGPLTLAPGQTVNLPSDATVHITNPSDNPVWVRDLNSARQPVSVFGFCQFSGYSCHKDLYTVPAGFHLVLEHLSMRGQLFDPQQFVDITLMRGVLGPDTVYGDAPFEFFVPEAFGNNTNGIVHVRDTHQTLMFFNQGEIVRLSASRNLDGFAGDVSVNFSGYLVAN